MVVQHNMQAANASRVLNITAGQQAKSTEKLSSGYRINRAADDAAGLSISEKMRKQIRGLDRASTNAQDGVSAVQTAEGALTEVHSMLQRMNELAVQSANGTNSDSDRNAIQSEIDQLSEEIDRVSETTKFNETFLLKGDGTKTVQKDVAATPMTATYKTAPTSTIALAKNKHLTSDGAAAGATNQLYLKGSTTALTDTDLAQVFEIASDGSIKVKDGVEVYTAAADAGTNYGAQVADKKVAETTLKGLVEISTDALASDANGANIVKEEDLKNYFEEDGSYKAKLYKNDNGTWKEVGADHINNFVTVTPAKDITTQDVVVPKALELSLHVGAESDVKNKISISIDSMSAEGIGIKDLKVDTEDSATAAIDTIADAIQKVSDQRSKLGAAQNRLEHTIDNLDNVVENTTSAESRIRDTDMADEMVKYSKNNILTQAGQSMLAQANQSTQGVLSLLQ